MENELYQRASSYLVSKYSSYDKVPDKYKYFYLFEYCVEKRVNELLSIARYNSFIDKVSIKLIDG